MDLDTSPELEAFRKEVQTFIQDHAPRIRMRTGVRAPESDADAELLKQWSADLFAAGYMGAEWPEEWGGAPDRDPMCGFIIAEEMGYANAPLPLGAGGLAAGALLQFGTAEQQQRYLGPIRNGTEVWCQLFSEPDAGSDLASLQTRAERDGDVYVLNGQKVWSTNAQYADLGYLLARTDPTVDKHAGITAFALDMRSPGVEVRPLREITGTTDFNEVFLTNVAIPADNVIGPENQGWMVATMSLVHERSGVASGGIRLKQAMTDLIELAERCRHLDRPASSTDDVRQELGRLYTEVQICNLLGYASLTRQLRGSPWIADAPIGKVFFSELNLALAQYGMELQRGQAVLVEGDPDAEADGAWQDAFLYARAFTIAGGSSEIMRNMLAERALGLPKDPRPAAK